jgi:ribA/ribD-fused uncharacterized protein
LEWVAPKISTFSSTMPSPRNLAELVCAEAQGAKFGYVFFLDYGGVPSGQVSEACLSQWWPSRLSLGGRDFCTAEQYMMFAKAEIFADHEAASKILASRTPFQAQLLGQRVRGFDQRIWVEHRERVVFEGNFAKFSQDERLGDYLLSTGTDILAEASPQDLVWGTGLGVDEPAAARAERWTGRNLLGFCLMRVRDALREGSDTDRIESPHPQLATT